jgi:hypothetical protein
MFEFLRIDLASARHARVDGLLHPVHVRGERGDEDAARATREDLTECLTDDALRLRDARSLGVRRVAEQQVHAEVAEVGELADVGSLAVDGRVVELVVAGVDDPPARGFEHDRGRVRDRVRHANQLDPEGTEAEGLVVGRDLAQLGVPQQPVLVELRLDEAEGQASRRDERDAAFAHQIGQRPDVVLVTVRQHDAADHVLALAQVGEVGQNEVDAEMLVAWKREPGVDDDDRVLRLVDGHVLPDLAETAERDDAADAHSRGSLGPRLQPGCTATRLHESHPRPTRC